LGASSLPHERFAGRNFLSKGKALVTPKSNP
jgi:hypothetical protein